MDVVLTARCVEVAGDRDMGDKLRHLVGKLVLKAERATFRLPNGVVVDIDARGVYNEGPVLVLHGPNLRYQFILV